MVPQKQTSRAHQPILRALLRVPKEPQPGSTQGSEACARPCSASPSVAVPRGLHVIRNGCREHNCERLGFASEVGSKTTLGTL